jgi:hypothetical protein
MPLVVSRGLMVTIALPAKVEESFQLSESEQFDYVFDLTGEVRPERSEPVSGSTRISKEAECRLRAGANRTNLQSCTFVRTRGSKAESECLRSIATTLL